jgi:16S rRNA A1518/A1519 N6-dimethyltransferase RsmA/KsgA/DIM1 with predicted DNA glycosylase/AP lyase activity
MILAILAIVFALVFCMFFVFPWIMGAPYDVSRSEALKNILKLTSPKHQDKIAELGSGDGRVCIALAKQNSKAKIYGFEINPFLVWISRRKIRKANLQNQIKIYCKNFWRINLSKYNKIVFFQFRSITNRLEKKFDKELKKGTKIISHNWKLPNYKIKKQIGKKGLTEGKVYLYEK